MIGDEIFADIESMYDINGEFVNYEVLVNDGLITDILAVEIR